MVVRDKCLSDDTSLCICELHFPRFARLPLLELGALLWVTSVSNAGFVGRAYCDGDLLRLSNEHLSDQTESAGQSLLVSVYAVPCVSAVVGSILVGEDDKALAAVKKGYELLFTGPHLLIDYTPGNPIWNTSLPGIGTILASRPPSCPVKHEACLPLVDYSSMQSLSGSEVAGSRGGAPAASWPGLG
jgi:hypothetical protein